MGLLDVIRSEQAATVVGPRCGVTIAIEKLGEEGADLAAAIADSTYTATVISKVMKDRGIQLGDSTIRRHRKGGCACPQPEQ